MNLSQWIEWWVEKLLFSPFIVTLHHPYAVYHPYSSEKKKRIRCFFPRSIVVHISLFNLLQCEYPFRHDHTMCWSYIIYWPDDNDLLWYFYDFIALHLSLLIAQLYTYLDATQSIKCMCVSVGFSVIAE